MAMIDNNSCDSGRKDLVELVNGGGAHEKRRSTQELSEDEPRGPDVLESDESHRITEKTARSALSDLLAYLLSGSWQYYLLLHTVTFVNLLEVIRMCQNF